MHRAMLKTAVALLVVLVVGLTSVDAIKCYVCDTSSDSGCGDPFTASSGWEQECASGWCMKAKGTKGSLVVVARACAEATTKELCTSGDQDGIAGIGCVCNSGLCNSARTIGAMGPLQLAGLAMTSLLVTAYARYSR
jgi:hypothetical protein